MVEPVQQRHARAPKQHGHALVDPPFADADRLLADNTSLIDQYSVDLQGRTLSELRQQARRELLDDAHRYTSEYRDVELPPSAVAGTPILVTGHQPQLFHPGVWFKNFALSTLGQQFNACGINLLIDNDPCRSPSIRVPSGSVDDPRIESVLFDQPQSEIPYEQREVQDENTFATFAERTADAIKPLVKEPLVARLWQHTTSASRATKNLGQRIAQARHKLEADCGLSTLELPFSRVCQSEPFFWFAAHLLAHLPRFWDVYNESLAEYRLANRIRSQSHPVPQLANEDEWLEAPFWIWTNDDPVRRRLFVRGLGEGIQLTDRATIRESVPLTPDGDAARAVGQLDELAQRGVKTRPRALITTMYARLILGDLFLHGIGGAKYDGLTDVIIGRFFGLQPPGFMTLTATTLLSVPRPNVDIEDLRRIDRQLRELRYQPERHVGDLCQPHSRLCQLVEEKRRWIDTLPPQGRGRERHERLTQLNDSLQAFVDPKRLQLLAERRELAADLRKKQLLGSREFSFCLFPEKNLCPLLLELSGAKP